MEQLLTLYGISFPHFQEAMIRTESTIAGSAALYVYLKSKGIDPEYEPNDIDIWVEDRSYTALQCGKYVHRPNISLIQQVLFDSGFSTYKKSNMPVEQDDSHDDYSTELAGIKMIHYLQNKDKKEVQIIHTKQMKFVEYMSQAFDLSVCATWWDPKENEVYTLQPYFTERKIMYFLNPTKESEKRTTKYRNRGFMLQESYPPVLYERDKRECGFEMDKSLQAFDVWNYEDVNCFQFLDRTPWNILLKIGDNFQAFHRTNLLEFMNKRMTRLQYIGEVFDTPMHQCITKEAIEMISYSDYSIFELFKEYSTSEVGIEPTKTLYSVKIYKADKWSANEEDDLISPMSRYTVETMQRIEARAVESEAVLRMILEDSFE
jgi:hypothetical protein